MFRWVLLFCLSLMALVANSGVALSAPATVDSATSVLATANSSQRKTFFDAENNRHWAFYYNGTAIEYSYSVDTINWVSVGTLPYNTANFSVAYKTISSVSYVFVVAQANNYDVVLRRGTLATSSISFAAAQTVYDGSSASDSYSKPTVAISENNHLWISAIKDFGSSSIERYQAQARRSTSLANGNLSTFNAATPVGRGSQTLRDAVIVSQSGDAMFLVSSTYGSNIVAYAFDGTNWALATTGGDFSWFGFGMIGLNGTVTSIAVSGTDIYVGGSFQDAGGIEEADYIARWDGAKWNSLGATAALNDTVKAIAITGTDIYVGGLFTDAAGLAGADYVARFDGTNWNALGTGLNNPAFAIGILGTDVYVGGAFWQAGGDPNISRIGRWDGAQWNELANGPNGYVYAIAVGSSSIYVGGNFNDIGLGIAQYIAEWDGASWNELGNSVDYYVFAIAVSGSDVYAGGFFTQASGVAGTAYFAKYNGSSWSALGSGVNAPVTAIAVDGTDVYVGGNFINAGGNPAADHAAKWNGTSWIALNTGLNNAQNAIAVSGSNVYFGGGFTDAGGVDGTNYIARWDGTTWNGLDTGGFNSNVNTMLVSGSDVYVGGSFINAGGNSAADRIAKWNGTSWSALGSGLNETVYSIAATGTDIYAAGAFTDAGGIAAADRIARFDGTTWSALASGLNDTVYSLAISGTDIFAGGKFTNAGAVAAADKIARWDGGSWNALGVGLNDTVRSIAISGTDIYAGGLFTDAGGVAAADRIARWDGGSWNAIGAGLNGDVYAIAVDGSDIYCGGQFSDAGGDVAADYVAKFSGGAWSALAAGLNGDVYALLMDGNDLYAGGMFTNAGGIAEADHIARFDGSAWSALGSGLDNTVKAIAALDNQIFTGGSSVSVAGMDQKAAIAYFAEAISNDADETTEISATSDSNGDIYLGFTDSSDQLHFRRYDQQAESWEDLVLLNAAASNSPALTYNEDQQKVITSWVQANAITYSQASTPYESGDWAVNETLFNTGTNAAVTVVANQESSDLALYWTNGAGSPYSILTANIDMTPPSVEITSSVVNPTPSSGVAVTITFSENVTGFVVGDIAVTNGAAGNFVALDSKTYSATITPAADGVVTVNVAAAVAKDAADFDNLAATQLSFVSDRTAPTVVINSSSASPTTVSPIPITIEFSENVTGFTLGDLSVANATASNFVAIDGNSYTAKITPTSTATVKVNIAAAVVVDSAGNSNSAATQFSISYVAPIVDSDGDGISDNQEAVDGTNPHDGGSFLNTLSNQWCSEWNGYLGMYNINEYVNLSSSKKDIVTTLFDIDGVAQSSLGISVSAGSQTDLLVHDMLGWTANSYGKVCSEVNGGKSGDVDGRMVYYKPNNTGFDFAFALPYYEGLKGSQFLTFNNMQPSQNPQDAQNVVGNWIQITNLASSQQSGRLIFYGQNGEVVKSESITLAPEARQDFAAHTISAALVGSIEWRPNSSSAKFALRNTRYFYDNAVQINSFDAALQLEGTKGSGELLSTVLDTRKQLAVLEVANVTSLPISASIKIYNAAGKIKETKNLTLPAHGSEHIVVNGILNSEIGSATIKGSVAEGVIAVAMHYGKSEEVVHYSIDHVYGVIAKQTLGKVTKGTYNTFLGQSCELQLVNASKDAVTTSIKMTRLDGTSVLSNRLISIPAKGTANFNACGAEEADRYGVVTVTAEVSNTILPLIVRSGFNGDYKFVTPVR